MHLASSILEVDPTQRQTSSGGHAFWGTDILSALQKTKHLLPSVFAMFYWCINLGSFASMASTPLLLKYLGPSTAFSVPGIFMAIALAVFWAGRNLYVLLKPDKDKQAGFLKVTMYCLKQTLHRRGGEVRAH